MQVTLYKNRPKSLIIMFVTAVCSLFSIVLRWPKNPENLQIKRRNTNIKRRALYKKKLNYKRKVNLM